MEPSPLSAVNAPSLIAARYRVLRELGRGGMGVVYVVEHVNTGDQLALKLLLAHAGASAVSVERFKREARAPARIKSEHVVRVTDADVAPELGGAPFLVMELPDGCDLEELLKRRGALPADEVVGYLAQVARGLDKAHSLGIVHRDLKPENLFLHRREDGSTVVKILDFGIAKVLGGDGTDMAGANLTGTGALMGTPLYMTPEQGLGDGARVGPRTDIWALGLIGYRLLTGSHYWAADTLGKLMVQIMVEPMPPPSSRFAGLGAGFDAWFARSCDRDPARRFPSVGEQVAALALALGVSLPACLSAARSSEPPGPAPPSSPPGQAAAPAPAAALGFSTPAVARTFSQAVAARAGGTRHAVLAAVAAVALSVVAGSLLVARAVTRARVPASAAASSIAPQAGSAASPGSAAPPPASSPAPQASAAASAHPRSTPAGPGTSPPASRASAAARGSMRSPPSARRHNPVAP